MTDATSTINPRSHKKVTALTGISYALPVVPVLALTMSINVLPGIYSQYHGLALAAISIVMLISGLFDAVTDPVIGYLSDRYHARSGSRRPFVVAGAILLVPSAWFLLNPPDGVTIGYFLVWYLVYYLALTLFTIPHLTWGGEMSPLTDEKTKIYAYRNYCTYVGLILFLVIPMMPWVEGTKITPEVMRYLVLVVAVLVLPSLYLMLRYAPKGVHPADQQRAPENPWMALLALGHNRPFLWFIAGSVLFALAMAAYSGLHFMLIDSYLGLGKFYIFLDLCHLLVAIVAIKPATKLIKRLGKTKAWKIASLLNALAFLIWPLILLNNAHSLYLLLLFFVIFALTSALGNVALYSLLSDISDYGTLTSGTDRSATYFSAQSLSFKTCFNIGIALTIALAAWFGLDPAALAQEEGTSAEGTQPDSLYWGLTLCIGVIPVVMSLAAAACISKIPITSHRHAIIRKRLDARVARQHDQNTADVTNNTPHLITG
ncbi:MFS transporter [Porticoccaceae bacterium]|nr:MFS transporter [Porticoccaceae bacterium]